MSSSLKKSIVFLKYGLKLNLAKGERFDVYYREFLAANNLREEAYEYVREHIDEEWPFEPFDWDIAQ